MADKESLISKEYKMLQTDPPKYRTVKTGYDVMQEMRPQIPECGETPLYWVDSEGTLEESLIKMSAELKECPLLACDLEYYNALPGQEGCVVISLIQISTQKSDYIIDCFFVRELIRTQPGLRSIFADAKITKIMHGCDSDMKYLVADLGIVTINLFDTARVFAFIQRIPPIDNILKDTL